MTETSKNSGGTPAPEAFLQEAYRLLKGAAAAIGGIAGLVFGIGFVLVNLSLLEHGVYESALVRERYVAASISYLILLILAAFVAIAVLQVIASLFPRLKPGWRAVVGLVPILLLDYFLTLLMWAGLEQVWQVVTGHVQDLFGEGTGAYGFNLPLFLWIVAAGWAGWGLYRAYPRRQGQAPPQDTGAPAAEGAKPATARPRSSLYLSTLGVVFLMLLLTYGSWVYETLPAALGGGLPIVVQFTGSEEQMETLSEMGVPLEDPTTTRRLDLIGQTSSRYFVIVRETRWVKPEQAGNDTWSVVAESTTLAFEKSLIQGIQYYPSEYQVSREYAAGIHVDQGDDLYREGYYTEALAEYDLALVSWPEYAAAYFGQGQIYLSRAHAGWACRALAQGEGDPSVQEMEDAVDRLTKAVNLDGGKARYWYQLARAQALRGAGYECSGDAAQGQTLAGRAIESLGKAIDADQRLGDGALDEPLFATLRAIEALDYGFEDLVFGGDLEEAAGVYAAEGAEHHEDARRSIQDGDDQVGCDALVEATTAYSQAVRLTGGSLLAQAGYRAGLADVYVARADACPEERSIALAVAQLESAVAQATENEAYRLALADAYARQGQVENALVHYEDLLRRNDENVYAWLGKGEMLVEQSEYTEALEAFGNATALVPDDVTVLYRIGQAWLRAEILGSAEEAFARIVELDPAYASTIAGDLGEAGVPDLQVHALEKIAEGDGLVELGRLEDAIVAYQEAVGSDPKGLYYAKLGDVYRTLAEGGEEDRYADALAAYSNAIEGKPDAPTYYVTRAALHAALGQTGSAIADYDKAIELDGTVAAYYAARAPLHVQNGQNTAAIADYQKAIELDAGNLALYEELALFYYDLGRYDEAIETANGAIDLDPTRGWAYYRLGLSYLAAGDEEAARDAFVTCTNVAESERQRTQCEDELIELPAPEA